MRGNTSLCPELSWCQNPVTSRSLLPFILSFLICSLCLRTTKLLMITMLYTVLCTTLLVVKGKDDQEHEVGAVVMGGQIERKKCSGVCALR